MNFVYYVQREIEDPSYVQLLQSNIVPYVPLWDVTGGIELSFNHKVTLLLTGYYTGDETQENYNYNSPTYSQAMNEAGFVILSAKLSYRPVKFLEVFAASDNLTDKRYSFVDGYPMPGICFRTGMEARF
jgi:outer membrane receptor protein involved in Fe transport